MDRSEELLGDSIGFDGESVLVKTSGNSEVIQYLKMIARANSGTVNFDESLGVWRCSRNLAADIAHVDALSWTQAFIDYSTHLRAFKGCEKSLTVRVRDYLTDLPREAPDGKILFDHQVSGIEFLLEKMRSILADDMGLGKTLQAILAARGLYEAATIPAIIITRAAIVEEWKRECMGQGLKAFGVYSWAKIPDPPEGKGFVVIGDEAHYAQNAKSARTKKFLKLCDKANAVFLLTGTPMANADPENLFPLLKAIGHPIGASSVEFRKRFVSVVMMKLKDGRRFPKKVGNRNIAELRKEAAPFILRRMKKDCLDLPEKTRIIRAVEPTRDQLKRWEGLKVSAALEYDARVESEEVKEGGKALAIMNALRNFSSREKMDETVELASEVIAEGRKVVIFTARVDTAKEMASRLGVKPLIGELNPREKDRMIQEFQNDPAVKAIVGTGEAAGTGTTLTAADTIIIHDRPLRPGDVEQWEDRLNRIGQKNAVSAYWVQMFEIDRVIDELLNEKQKVVEQVIDGKEESKAVGLISAREVIARLL
jgi:SNF2 family DNA or RNA helicase